MPRVPFLEAILSALPVCDEFLISDGYSTDHTWSSLERLKENYPHKITLFRDHWRGSTACGQVLATMTNLLKNRCAGDYCLNLQANEVLHESSADQLRKLPTFFPGVDIFSFPFYTLHGSSILWTVDFRKRLFRNIRTIISQGDAYDVDYDKLALLCRPTFSPTRYVHKRIQGAGYHQHHLPKPFFRYRSLSPKNYVIKLSRKLALYQRGNVLKANEREYHYAKEVLQQTSSHRDVQAFWNTMKIYFNKVRPEDNFSHSVHGISRSDMTEGIDNPSIMRHLLNKWEYTVQESLQALDLGTLTD